ncbi:MAG: S26 family signal peptidase [Phytoplasma sp.]|uniref:S26 family signal peptidase n=1 Tax=Phytoplasma sp. TaxID=2155 RepID=UPI002B41041B|nr:S26 family signal peptidase [Phytoplasma sp.]WRH06935.1 MAG: S26 family signal peptidase [Phytoplasma sp.]
MIAKKISRFCNFIIYFLYYVFVFILIYFILLNISNYLFPKHTSKFIFFNIHHISSGSMKPKYDKNDLIVIKRITDKEREELKKGECVVFYIDEQFQTNPVLRQNPFILHEVQKNNKTERFITTKGKANKESLDLEKHINYDNVLFKILYSIPLSKITIKNRYFSYFFVFIFFLSMIILLKSKFYYIIKFIKMRFIKFKYLNFDK